MRVCLDVSHSKLACNHHRWSFHEFLNTVGPHTAHLHMADASGVDGEGLQVGEGDVDWVAVCGTLDRLAPSATFIPEIWQGHKNEGEGFWVALDRLENAWLRAGQVAEATAAAAGAAAAGPVAAGAIAAAPVAVVSGAVAAAPATASTSVSGVSAASTAARSKATGT
jgi:hypothetical protein